MDEREQRKFIRFLAKELKTHSRELMVYQLFAHLLKKTGFVGVDELLDQARNAPALQAKFEKNFEHFDELIPPEDLDGQEWAKGLLEKWTPTGGEPN